MLQFATFATNVSCFAKERCILSVAKLDSSDLKGRKYFILAFYTLLKNDTFFCAKFSSVPVYLFTVVSIPSPFTFAMNTPAPCPFFKYLFQIFEYGFLFATQLLIHFH
jgi:hypothetical protein